MKKLLFVTALLLTGTAAHAGNSISFSVDGRKVQIAVPKNCDALSCLSISASGFQDINLKNMKFGNSSFGSSRADDDDDSNAAAAPAPASVMPQQSNAAPLSPPIPAPVAAPIPAPATTASTAPAPLPAPVTTAAPVSAPVINTARPAAVPTSPLGVWSTEDDKGMVRIEACGDNLCGTSVETKPGKKAEKVLIDMKPVDGKWTGQIHDPDSGRSYDSTIAMKGANTLKVQGCAFGGLFCGGQIWNRVS
jgi:uncharacterized protein (DUF2147 family)